MHDHDILIKEPERYRLTGLSRTQWWRLAKQGKVPESIRVGERIQCWRLGEIKAFVESRRGAPMTG